MEQISDKKSNSIELTKKKLGRPKVIRTPEEIEELKKKNKKIIRNYLDQLKHCDICNRDMKEYNYSRHLKSIEHLKNIENKDTKVITTKSSFPPIIPIHPVKTDVVTTEHSNPYNINGYSFSIYNAEAKCTGRIVGTLIGTTFLGQFTTI